MKIVWEHSIYVGEAPVFCAICDRRSYPIKNSHNQLLLAVIYDKRGVVWGEACRDCVAAGSEAIQARLQERMLALQKKMDGLQMLSAEKIETPSLEQEFQIHLRS
ncbi:MAG: hypothetical protein KME15_04635 [Drouetiella hepatica Uher 2000/2452]|jgi:Zn-finger protein|uniref:Uncharacterized protein n=1 Tax=Drouetiella hepatica Uher 2000/2452 TaxID=904376 RepID=A0A951UMS0_9CYAN|nr:hypothetical protein [Drouetiella hepatica Uher 2000/2452]